MVTEMMVKLYDIQCLYGNIFMSFEKIFVTEIFIGNVSFFTK